MNKRVMKRCLRIPSTTYSHPAGMHMHFLCVYTYRKLSSLFSFRAKVTEKSVWDEREKKTRNEGHNLGLAKIVPTYGSIWYLASKEFASVVVLNNGWLARDYNFCQTSFFSMEILNSSRSDTNKSLNAKSERRNYYSPASDSFQSIETLGNNILFVCTN